MESARAEVAAADGITADGGQVQLYSDVAKGLQDLELGVHGNMFPGLINPGLFDDETYCNLVRLSDLALLREGYKEWYKHHGGKQLEKELVEAFNRRAHGTNLQQYTAGRFTSILRKAIELDEEGDDDDGLLEACRQVISDDKRLDMDSFVELQQFTYDVKSYLHDLLTRSAFLDAARRVLTHRTFTDLLAEKLREVGFGIGLCT